MKFSIVTPTYNSEKYLADTIESVLSQDGNFEIEYIIVDGGSTDKTIEIIKKYAEKYPIRWVSEKDSGMYDAINKGFEMATGDVFAWINSDDVYLTNTFQAIKVVLEKYLEINWLKGITLVSNEKLETTNRLPCYIYNQDWIKKGVYGRNAYFIHQDSVFWRKDLWKKAGNIPKEFKFAGDYYLWTQFAKYSPLWSLDQPVSRFRKTTGQLSEDMAKYREEQEKIIPKTKSFILFKIKLFFGLKSKSSTFFYPLFILLYKLLFWNKNISYIKIKNGTPIKRKSFSYTK